MRLIFGFVLVVGIGLAGLAAYMAKNYMEQQLAKERQVKPVQPTIKTVGVYVAKRPLKYGEKIAPEDVTLVEWPEKALPEGAFTARNPVYPEGVQDPRYVVRAMEAFEPVLEVKVTAPGEPVGIASQLGKGMRAFTMKVDATSGVSGFLRPGDYVDVYWSGQIDRGTDRMSGSITKLIESGVQIVAVDQNAASDETTATVARTVTVAVTPKQVAALAQAQATGRLSLSLVGFEADVISEAIEIDQADLLGIEAAPAPAPVEEAKVEAPKVCTIRTRRGAEVVEIPIPCTN